MNVLVTSTASSIQGRLTNPVFVSYTFKWRSSAPEMSLVPEIFQAIVFTCAYMEMTHRALAKIYYTLTQP